jgi:hypothetical protein
LQPQSLVHAEQHGLSLSLLPVAVPLSCAREANASSMAEPAITSFFFIIEILKIKILCYLSLSSNSIFGRAPANL